MRKSKLSEEELSGKLLSLLTLSHTRFSVLLYI